MSPTLIAGSVLKLWGPQHAELNERFCRDLGWVRLQKWYAGADVDHRFCSLATHDAPFCHPADGLMTAPKHEPRLPDNKLYPRFPPNHSPRPSIPHSPSSSTYGSLWPAVGEATANPKECAESTSSILDLFESHTITDISSLEDVLLKALPALFPSLLGRAATPASSSTISSVNLAGRR